VRYLSENLTKPLPSFAHATFHQDLIFTSCIQGFSPGQFELPKDVAKESEQMFSNLVTLLAECESDLDHVLKITLFFTHLDRDFLAVNQVLDQFFQKPPARSSIGVKELPRGCRVVVEAIAKKASSFSCRADPDGQMLCG
jgi:2-iminobutanoate/2-iminopropanoate deaminase